MSGARKPLQSNMGWSDRENIVVQGLDLPNQIMGVLNLGDFAFLEIMGRVPTPPESVMFNAMLATLVEHGMTPMAMVARLTYLGAPESMQAAVAAGLNGMGTTFAGTAEGAARILQEALPTRDVAAGADLPGLAKSIVERHRAQKLTIPGIGHPVHKPVDPRSVRLFALAEQNGILGPYVRLMQLIAEEAERASGKRGGLPVNATGALAAVSSEMGIPWRVCRGLAVIGRSIGLVGHLAEEMRNPLGLEMWRRADEEVVELAKGGTGSTS